MIVQPFLFRRRHFLSVKHLSLMSSTEISLAVFIILHFKKHQRFSIWKRLMCSENVQLCWVALSLNEMECFQYGLFIWCWSIVIFQAYSVANVFTPKMHSFYNDWHKGAWNWVTLNNAFKTRDHLYPPI